MLAHLLYCKYVIAFSISTKYYSLVFLTQSMPYININQDPVSTTIHFRIWPDTHKLYCSVPKDRCKMPHSVGRL